MSKEMTEVVATIAAATANSKERLADKLIGIVWKNLLCYDVCNSCDFRDMYMDCDWYNEDNWDELYQEFLNEGDRFINRNMSDDEMIDFLDKYCI